MNLKDPFGLVGQVLDGQFRVESLVGEGGFSAVYRGHHLGLDEPVAIKCLKLPPALGQDLVDSFVRRFRDESRILYRLSQGNLHILRAIAAGATTSKTAGFPIPYMVLEWLEGRSLATDFAFRKSMGKSGRALSEVIDLFGSAADALAYAHGQGVVHRDLNPGNFFLTNTNEGVKLKVLDFGVAKILDDSTLKLGPRAQTIGQIRIFAPAYGAPEQFDDGLGKVGAPSDVYSLALVLMEALRDRPVNEGNNLGDFAFAAIDAKRRPTPSALGIDVPDSVERVFARATRLSPAERYPNVGAMWGALVMATSPTSTKRSERFQKTGGPAQPLMRTLPLGSPNFAGGAVPRPAAAANPPRVGGDEDDEDDLPTQVGQLAGGSPNESGPDSRREDEEEEATRVRVPEPEILAAAQAQTEPPAPPRSPTPPSGNTLMMHPLEAVPIPAPPAPLVPKPPHQPPPQHSPMPPQARVSHEPRGALGATVALGSPSPFQAGPPGGPVPTGMHQAPFAPAQGSPFQYGGVPSAPSAFGEPAQAAPAKKLPLAIIVGAAAFVGALVLAVGIFFLVRSSGDEAPPVASAAPDPSPVPTPAPTPSAVPAPPAATETAANDGAEEDAGKAAADETPPPTPDETATAASTATATAWAPSTATAAPKPAHEDVDSNAWNEAAARARLSQANGVLVFCRRKDGLTGPGTAMVTFSPDGSVTAVAMQPPYDGTKEGDCVAGQFRRKKIDPFEGPAHTIQHTFEVPK